MELSFTNNDISRAMQDLGKTLKDKTLVEIISEMDQTYSGVQGNGTSTTHMEYPTVQSRENTQTMTYQAGHTMNKPKQIEIRTDNTAEAITHTWWPFNYSRNITVSFLPNDKPMPERIKTDRARQQLLKKEYNVYFMTAIQRELYTQQSCHGETWRNMFQFINISEWKHIQSVQTHQLVDIVDNYVIDDNEKIILYNAIEQSPVRMGMIMDERYETIARQQTQNKQQRQMVQQQKTKRQIKPFIMMALLATMTYIPGKTEASQDLTNAKREIYFETAMLTVLQDEKELLEVTVPVFDINTAINQTKLEIQMEKQFLKSRNDKLQSIAKKLTLDLERDIQVYRGPGNTIESRVPLTFVQCKLFCGKNLAEMANLFELKTSYLTDNPFHVNIGTNPLTIFDQRFRNKQGWATTVKKLIEDFQFTPTTQAKKIIMSPGGKINYVGKVRRKSFNLSPMEDRAYCRCSTVPIKINTTNQNINTILQKAQWANHILQRELLHLEDSLMDIGTNIMKTHEKILLDTLQYRVLNMTGNIHTTKIDAQGNIVMVNTKRQKRNIIENISNNLWHLFGASTKQDTDRLRSELAVNNGNINKIKKFLLQTGETTATYRSETNRLLTNVEQQFLGMSNQALKQHLINGLLATRLGTLHSINLIRQNIQSIKTTDEQYQQLSEGRLPTRFQAQINGHTYTTQHVTTFATTTAIVFQFQYYPKKGIYRTRRLRNLPVSLGKNEMIIYDNNNDILLLPKQHDNTNTFATINLNIQGTTSYATDIGDYYVLEQHVPPMEQTVDSCTAAFYVNQEANKQVRDWCAPFIRKKTIDKPYMKIERTNNYVFVATTEQLEQSETCTDKNTKTTIKGITYIPIKLGCSIGIANKTYDYNPLGTVIKSTAVNFHVASPKIFQDLHEDLYSESYQRYLHAGKIGILEDTKFLQRQTVNEFAMNKLGLELTHEEFAGAATGLSIAIILVIICIVLLLCPVTRMIICNLCESMGRDITKCLTRCCHTCCDTTKEETEEYKHNKSSPNTTTTSILRSFSPVTTSSKNISFIDYLEPNTTTTTSNSGDSYPLPSSNGTLDTTKEMVKADNKKESSDSTPPRRPCPLKRQDAIAVPRGAKFRRIDNSSDSDNRVQRHTNSSMDTNQDSFHTAGELSEVSSWNISSDYQQDPTNPTEALSTGMPPELSRLVMSDIIITQHDSSADMVTARMTCYHHNQMGQTMHDNPYENIMQITIQTGTHDMIGPWCPVCLRRLRDLRIEEYTFTLACLVYMTKQGDLHDSRSNLHMRIKYLMEKTL